MRKGRQYRVEEEENDSIMNGDDLAISFKHGQKCTRPGRISDQLSSHHSSFMFFVRTKVRYFEKD